MGRGENKDEGWLSDSASRPIIPKSDLANLKLSGLRAGLLRFDDGEILISWRGVSARLTGEVLEFNDSQPLSEGRGTVASAEIRVEAGNIISEEGVTELAPGIYRMTGSGFERISNLAGIDDRGLAAQIAADKFTPGGWEELSVTAREALLSVSDSGGVGSLDELAIERSAAGSGGEEVWASRELLKVGLNEALELGLVTVVETVGDPEWRLTASGSDLLRRD